MSEKQRENQSSVMNEFTEVLTVTGDFDVELYNLLINWNLENLYMILKGSDITYESLQYLSKEDIRDAITSIGLRAIFREKLFTWKKEKFGIDETTSVESRVLSWLKSVSNPSLSASNPGSTSDQQNDILKSTLLKDKSNLKFNLSSLLKSSTRGRNLQDFYIKNGQLLEYHRQQLISIILEHFNFSGRDLAAADFPNLCDQIVESFPIECKEYYFVPRQGKKNPKGKLYDKYINLKAKIKKVNKVYNGKKETDQINNTPDFDETIAQSLKLSLSRNCDNWDEVKLNWEHTFLLRQKEINQKSVSNIEFLEAWPRYKDSKGYELIQIDFRLIYPGKEHLLSSKWTQFKCKILPFYQDNIHDKESKNLLLGSRQLQSEDSVDYIYAQLLNAVILPTSRFPDKRKTTIKDAQKVSSCT